MTVSRAMNGQRGMSEATRERVLHVARTLGYVRNPSARALAGALPPRMAVILAAADRDAATRVLRGFEAAARGAGRPIAVRSHEGDGDDLVALIAAELGADGVSGLCVIADTPPEVGSRFAVAPLVTVSLGGRDSRACVSLDRAAGRRAAVEQLIALGHDEIALVGAAPEGDLELRSRLRAVGASGVRLRVVAGENTADFGFAVGSSGALLGEATAVVAAHDRVAVGLLHGLRRRGVAVPGEISVVGADDIPDARHFVPALTSIGADFGRLGRLAFAHLSAKVASEPAPAQRAVVPRLVVRASMAASVHRSTNSVTALASALV